VIVARSATHTIAGKGNVFIKFPNGEIKGLMLFSTYWASNITCSL
jgi:hypothetical protein